MARTIDLDIELPVIVTPSAPQVQADWNQNDDTQPDFINNRICYEEESSTSEVVLFDVVLNSSGCITGYAYQDGTYFVPVSFPKGFTIDKYTTYTVTLGDQTMTYNFNGSSGASIVGDGIEGGGYVLIGSSIPVSLDCDMAFCFNYNPTAYDGVHLKQVVQVTNDGIKKIDDKFLPEGIGSEKRETVTIFDRDFEPGNFVWDYEPLKLGSRYKMTITYLFDTEYTSTTIVTPTYDSTYDTYTLPFSISYLNAQTGTASNAGGALYYNASSTQEYTGNYGFAGGHMKLEKLVDLKKIDEKFVDLPTNLATTDYVDDIFYSNKLLNRLKGGTGIDAIAGSGTTASGQKSFAFGNSQVKATGAFCVAFNDTATASGHSSAAIGNNVTASALASFATNYFTQATNSYSSSFGNSTIASGQSSLVCGQGTEANHKSQFAFGEYNVQDPSTAAASAKGNYVEIVGNGTSASSRSNARTLDWSGNEQIAGTLRIGSTTTGGVLLKEDSGSLKISFDNGATWLTVQAS